MSKLMRPGQIEPNDFELAVLERIAAKSSEIKARIVRLHVLSREFTGVGSYTKFSVPNECVEAENSNMALDDLIVMPNVADGMGAVLWCVGGFPERLEIFTFGAALWDGIYDGYFITHEQLSN